MKINHQPKIKMLSKKEKTMSSKPISKQQGNKIAKEKAFEFQLQTLTLEMGYIERAISRIDQITQTTKYWAILIWTGSISLIFSQGTPKQFIIFTLVVPLMFLFVDARWRYWLGHFSYRQIKISEFVNSEKLQIAFKTHNLSELIILDPLGISYRDTLEFKKKKTFIRAIRSTEVWPLYTGMILISIILWAFFYFNPTL
ncbi:MAG: hypothetical protein JNK81_10935 [Anaerolineales bacterium]|nr:hypothetical protein [Anaerolineales bacterium]